MIRYWDAQEGGGQPLTLKIRSGCDGGGKGPLIQTDKSATLSTLQDQTLFAPTDEPIYCIQGNCIDRADTAGCNGKGWTEDVSYTLNTIDRPAVSQPMAVDLYNGKVAKDVAPTLTAALQRSGNTGPSVIEHVRGGTQPTVIALENHPNDSRLKISEDNVVQTLSGRMGTGGGNTPMVLECYSQDAFAKYNENECSATLRQSGGDYGGGSETLIVSRGNW